MDKYISADKLKRSIEAQCRVLRAIGIDELTEMADVLSAGFIQEIENAPTEDVVVAPRWIPVTDGLPEKEGQYLVSCDTVYGIEVARFYIDEDGERCFGCDWNDPDDIEAWMPLPEPYKRGEWKNERT